MPSLPPRRSRSLEKSTSADKMDLKDKLQICSIFYDKRATIPDMTELHIKDLHKPQQALSPNEKRIEEMAAVVRL